MELARARDRVAVGRLGVRVEVEGDHGVRARGALVEVGRADRPRRVAALEELEQLRLGGDLRAEGGRAGQVRRSDRALCALGLAQVDRRLLTPDLGLLGGQEPLVWLGGGREEVAPPVIVQLDVCERHVPLGALGAHINRLIDAIDGARHDSGHVVRTGHRKGLAAASLAVGEDGRVGAAEGAVDERTRLVPNVALRRLGAADAVKGEVSRGTQQRAAARRATGRAAGRRGRRRRRTAGVCAPGVRGAPPAGVRVTAGRALVRPGVAGGLAGRASRRARTRRRRIVPARRRRRAARGGWTARRARRRTGNLLRRRHDADRVGVRVDLEAAARVEGRGAHAHEHAHVLRARAAVADGRGHRGASRRSVLRVILARRRHGEERRAEAVELVVDGCALVAVPRGGCVGEDEGGHICWSRVELQLE